MGFRRPALNVKQTFIPNGRLKQFIEPNKRLEKEEMARVPIHCKLCGYYGNIIVKERFRNGVLYYCHECDEDFVRES
jgi:transposase-like protein